MAQLSAHLELTGERADASRARRFVVETLEGWKLDDAVADATLVVSELVTNAVLHARTEIVVALHRRATVIRLEVSDGAIAAPQVRTYSDTAGTGRGLNLVAQLATQWGTEASAGGKTVWCELPLATTGAAAVRG